jgi:hypothetical protein
MARLIVSGASIVWTGKVGRGGHIMYALQWLHGLKQLGHEVLYYDRIDDRPESAALFGSIMESWWEPRLSAAVRASGESASGLGIVEIEAFARQARGIVCLGCQFSPDPDPWLAHVRPRVFIDQDPGYSQLWAEDKSIESVLGRHDLHFTVGPNIGTPRSPLPTLGLRWRPIWNPVLSDWWSAGAAPAGARFTTIAGLWLNGYQPFAGVTWGPKAEELRRFLRLPALAGEAIELASEAGVGMELATELEQHGWRITSAELAAPTAAAYREYIQAAAGEFSCAKGLYVGSRCGWFSDRSACFLAAGRPVVIQDTGLRELLPTGEGLFAVATVEEAADAIRQIRSDYTRHSARARAIAEEHFDARRVLPRLLEPMGLGPA